MYFVFTVGILLLPLGLLGIALIVFYTQWITKRPIICLVAPGLAFGPLMVLGTHFVLTGSYSWTAFAASLVPGFLVSDLLLLNQFPDVEADKTVGRKYLPDPSRKGECGPHIYLFPRVVLLCLSLSATRSA